ncbi:hypothetical protein [Chitinimonas sp.]|uniref:hypothetical protein n=1 Tax=Chitinimonas sp. TaxID=1934313 RepID=UPI0035AE8F02
MKQEYHDYLPEGHQILRDGNIILQIASRQAAMARFGVQSRVAYCLVKAAYPTIMGRSGKNTGGL